MRFLSVCSGIEAASVAWAPLGWQAVGFSEIDKFPSAVLAHHYPQVTNYGDMQTFKDWNCEQPNVLVGGTPCQSFSFAGLRKGLADPRGNLMLTYAAIARHYRPQWLVWENVPGVLSSNGGRDFGTFLTALAECGYGFAYRVLNAQYFGVAQRRRRVFVVANLKSWRRAAAVLFEQQSLQGHPPPCGKTRQTAPTIPSRRTAGGGLGTDFDLDGGLIEQPYPVATGSNPQVMASLNATDGDKWGCDQWVSEGKALIVPREPTVASTIKACSFTGGASGKVDGAMGGHLVTADIAPNLTSNGDAHTGFRDEHGLVACKRRVRRLTPQECERLQGFPDDYTDIRPNGKPTADSPRYKALGNSMAVPVMRWIGERIQQVEAIA